MNIQYTIEVLLQRLGANEEKINDIKMFYEKPYPDGIIKEIEEYETKSLELKKVIEFLETHYKK